VSTVAGSFGGIEVQVEVPAGPALSDSRTAHALRRYRLVGWLSVVIGVAAFISSLVVISDQANAANELLRIGRQTPGVVTHYSPGFGNYTDGYFDVTYVADGARRSGVVHLTETSASYRVGEHVTVVYDPKQPTRIRTPQEQNEPASTVWPIIIGMVGGLGLLIGGWIVLVHHGRWKRVLERGSWVAYHSRYVRPRGGTPGFVLTPTEDSATGPFAVRLQAISRWRLARLARSAPQTVWVAGDPHVDAVIGLPATGEVFGASPPRGRAGRRFVKALHASGQLPANAPPPS
jgi:uncharacterized protein DUF3592